MGGFRLAITDVSVTDVVGVGAAARKSLALVPDFEMVALVDHPLGVLLAGFAEVHYFEDSFDQDDAFVRQLAAVSSGHQLEGLLPCGDRELESASRRADEIRRLGIACMVPRWGDVLRAQKPRLSETSRLLGWRTPRTLVVEDESPPRGLEYPLLLKGPKCGVLEASDDCEFASQVRFAQESWGLPTVVQELAKGVEVSIAGVASEQHEVIASCAIRKIGITNQGKTWMAVTIENDRLLRMASDFAAELSWSGPFEIECILERGVAKPTVIEINPRLPAWCSAVTSTANLALVVARQLRGESPAAIHGAAGLGFCRVFRTASFPIRELAQLVTQGRLERHAG